MPEHLKTVGNLMVKNSLQGFDAEQHTYILGVVQYRSKSVAKCFVFIIFEYSHDAVSKMCWLEFRFQNLLFSQSASKKCAVFV